ncbi:MAG: D-glycero-beta-D-manno-heptose 1-phosphate adenylyltransferase [Acidiferrobacteraceae bacterium]
MTAIVDKVITSEAELGRALAKVTRPLVFTNGCFDLLHRGHTHYLEAARALGSTLLVALNSDASITRLEKGPGRPINRLEDRMDVVAALESVSFVVAFDEDTPLGLIMKTRPDVLVKGGDWNVEEIVGAREVRSWGGRVATIPVRFACSTTAIADRIRMRSP